MASQTLVFIHYLREYYNRPTEKYLVYAEESNLLCKTHSYIRAKRIARQAFFDFGESSVRDYITKITLFEYK